MFQDLVGSGGRKQVGASRGLVVAALHGLLIAGAIRATTVPPPREKPKVYDVVLVGPPEPPPPAAPTTAATTSAPDVSAPQVELPAPPVDVPTSIPPVTSAPPLDPALLRRVTGPTVPGPVRGDSAVMSRVRAASEVDEPAVAIHQPAPRYPPVLQQAGLEGRVLVEFVIDPSGHLEPASFRVLQTSNPGFDPAARETVERSLFRPARVRGHPVRQRTIQSIVFRIVPN